MSTTKLTPQIAQEHAKKAVGNYLNACDLQGASQIGDVLMMLLSTAGVMLANAVGSEEAYSRMVGTAQFVVNTMPAAPAQLRPMAAQQAAQPPIAKKS